MRERRTAGPWALAAVLAWAGAAGALVACGPTGAFLCQSDAECIDGRGQGICQSIGYCSFPDGACDSGQRYGQHSDDFSNECVQPSDAATDSADASGSNDGTASASASATDGATGGTTAGAMSTTTPSPTTQTTANTLSTTETSGADTGDESGGNDDSSGGPSAEADLALWLDFDGDVSTDDSTYAHQPGCIAECPAVLEGQFGGGASCSTSGLSVPGHPALDFSGPFTVSLWTRAEGPQNFGRGTLIAQPYDDTSSYDLSIQDLDGDSIYDLVSAAEGIAGAALDVFAVGDWVHVAVLYAEGHQQVFVNGASRIDAGTPAITSQQTDVVVGRHVGALNFGLNGVVDDVRVYRRLLSVEELAAVMDGAEVQ